MTAFCRQFHRCSRERDYELGVYVHKYIAVRCTNAAEIYVDPTRSLCWYVLLVTLLVKCKLRPKPALCLPLHFSHHARPAVNCLNLCVRSHIKLHVTIWAFMYTHNTLRIVNEHANYSIFHLGNNKNPHTPPQHPSLISYRFKTLSISSTQKINHGDNHYTFLIYP